MKSTTQNIKAIRLQFGDLTITAEVEARLEELGFTPETLIDAIGEHKSGCEGNPSIYCGTYSKYSGEKGICLPPLRASCAAMHGFQPLCFAPMVFRTATSCTCATLCLCRHHLLSSFASRFDPAGFHSLNFILRRKVMAYRGTARASLHSVFLAVSLPCNDAITLAFAAIRSQCHFVAV